MFKSSSLELKDRKVSDPKVMLKSEFAKKKSLRLKFVKVGIGHPPAQTPMSDWVIVSYPPSNSPVLNTLTDSACLILIGRLLNDLAALHRKLSKEISKLDLLVGFSCPLFACLVLKLYSVENMEKRYLGDFVFMTLYTRMEEW